MHSSLPVLLLAGLLAACDDGANGAAGGAAAQPGPTPRSDRALGLAVGQEIWVAYTSPEFDPEGRRWRRTREEALALAQGLRERVAAGADLGELAWEHSNAPGGCALGFSGVLPRDRDRPDARDLALLRVRPGELTELVEWRGGWWFARRLTPQAAAPLQERFERLARTRVRARVIHIHHKDAYPQLYNIKRSAAEAQALAQACLDDVLRGADFARVARERSEDTSGEFGGVLTTKHGGLTEPTEWLTVADPYFTWQLLKILFVDGAVGRVWPQVVVHGRGMDVVEVLERKELQAPGSAGR